MSVSLVPPAAEPPGPQPPFEGTRQSQVHRQHKEREEALEEEPRQVLLGKPTAPPTKYVHKLVLIE